MRKILLFLAIGLLSVASVSHADAQSVMNALTVASCGGQSLATGQFLPATQDTTGKLCTSGSGGGGGGAITMAAGAVASGAYSSGSIASGAYAVGSLTDGAITTLGTEADAAWSGTGSGTDTAILKAIWAGVTGSIPGPLGPSTSPSSAVSITDTGSPITGQTLGAGGQGLSGWLSQINASIVNNLVTKGQTTMSGSLPVAIASDQSAVPVTSAPATSGGLSNYFVQPTAGDNHAVIKAGAGQVYKIVAFNNSATVNYLRLYNATTGFNGCNSATNLVGQWQIPASTSVGGIIDSWNSGLAFSTGISICVTSGYATTDTTNATATAMSINIGYK